MITEETRSKIESRYGALLTRNGKRHRINPQGMAALYGEISNCVYSPTESAFCLYDPESGLWKAQGREEMLCRLGLFLHECAKIWNIPEIEEQRTPSVLSGILKFLIGIRSDPDFFKQSAELFIHCANGVLELAETGDWVLKPFSPMYRSRNRCEIHYSPGACCPRFLNELLHPLLQDDDMELIQQYVGQCLTGRNITQSILMLTGSGGSGKGTLANIVELLIGEGNYTQIRPEQITSRFESSFFRHKTLLTGKESNRSFFTAQGMQVLKSLVGDDKLRAELKNSNQHEMITGVYNIFIVGNTVPVLELESKDEASAWRRRLRWVKCKNAKPAKPIPSFDQKLIAEEGPGILNWALEGAKKVVQSGSSSLLSGPSQQTRLDYLFHASQPLDFFLATTVEKRPGTTITGDDLFRAFMEFAVAMEWPVWSQREFQKKIPDAMLRHFGSPLRRDVPRRRADGKTTNRSGYFHVAFKH